MGSIAVGDVQILNEDVVRALCIPRHVVDSVAALETEELQRRNRLYRDGKPPPNASGHTVILVDDGLATGASMRAAVTAIRRQAPRRIVVAVPVAAPSTCRDFEAVADLVVCLATPYPFQSVGFWYQDFSQTSDDEVRELLKQRSDLEPAPA